MPSKLELEQQLAELQAQMERQEATADRLAAELCESCERNDELTQELETLQAEFVDRNMQIQFEQEEHRKEARLRDELLDYMHAKLAEKEKLLERQRQRAMAAMQEEPRNAENVALHPENGTPNVRLPPFPEFSGAEHDKGDSLSRWLRKLQRHGSYRDGQTMRNLFSWSCISLFMPRECTKYYLPMRSVRSRQP